MSLVVDISVNRDQEVGTITIQRMTGGTDPDDVNRYEYTVYDHRGGVVATGHVMHRYGDKAFRLLAKALLDCQERL